ncbi:30S ribosomal protein S6 [Thamnocephalis sphaerospora]|uniref:30S ribosomal protein S6 n=1 Tax=Thamnocephalis sphaerospora TaxID=78915 RepID=A0A4P9XTB4_9FUNG|nr:30S ribosomal protein S6 [Thamnocephalis sphaerospora]|eukprot:RKP08781.1 30S ribosomal protein S6 [Thamnocephalis sphaerospora]
MPFYELVCIARARLTPAHLSEVLRTSARTVLDRGGVVRGFQNLGERELPYRMKRHQMYHTRGRYWLMHFDANPATVNELAERLRVDTRVVRHTMIKLGDRLDSVIARPDKTHLM